MPFDARIKELSERLANCGDDAEALQIAQQLQTLLHEKIQQLRDKTAAIAIIGRSQRQTDSD